MAWKSPLIEAAAVLRRRAAELQPGLSNDPPRILSIICQ